MGKERIYYMKYENLNTYSNDVRDKAVLVLRGMKKESTEFLNYTYITREVRRLIGRGETGIHHVLRSIDLSKAIKHSCVETEIFECPLMLKPFKARIKKDKYGYYHYSSRMITTNDTMDVADMDLIDLITFDLGKTQKGDGIAKIQEWYQIPEDARIAQKRDEYRDTLHRFMDSVHDGNYRLTYVLDVLMMFAEKQLNYVSNPDKEEYDFSYSMESMQKVYMERFGENISKSTLSQYITLLAVYGVIQKKGIGQVTPFSAKKAKLNRTTHKFSYERNKINFYNIKTVDEEMFSYMDKVEKLNLKYYDMTFETINKHFGFPFVCYVFPGHKDMRIKKSRFGVEKADFNLKFMLAMKKNGYVVKSQLRGIVPDTIFNSMWTKAVKRFAGKRAKLNAKWCQRIKIMKETGAIFLSHIFGEKLSELIEKLEEKYRVEEKMDSDESFKMGFGDSPDDRANWYRYRCQARSYYYR